jgi:hypothetical protein
MDPVIAIRTENALGVSGREQSHRSAKDQVALLGRRDESVVDSAGSVVLDQWKESPHAQLPPAFGLSMVKPCFSMVSAKSIEAPSR